MRGKSRPTAARSISSRSPDNALLQSPRGVATAMARRPGSRDSAAGGRPGGCHAARQRFIDQLYQMADRVASVVLTAGPASPEELAQAEVDAARGTWGRNIDRVRVALVDDLVATNGDWDSIDKLCVTADWAPADAIAMVLTRDRKLAMRMLNRWCREHGYSRRPAWPRCAKEISGHGISFAQSAKMAGGRY